MSTAFVAGLVAGYGIAIPVGVIAVLLIDTGLRLGFRLAAAAATGIATADGLYALVAAVFGTALAQIITPWAGLLRLIAVLVLLALAIRLVVDFVRGRDTRPRDAERMTADVAQAEATGSSLRTYAVFLGLTLLNPITVTYFAALILGLTHTGADAAEKAAFVAGAFVASLSWQLTLAAIGAFLHRQLPNGVRRTVLVIDIVIVVAFAAVIGSELVTA